MTKQWDQFDFKFRFNRQEEVRVSILAVDEKAARKRLSVLVRGDSQFLQEERWTLHSATYNRDGSPVL